MITQRMMLKHLTNALDTNLVFKSIDASKSYDSTALMAESVNLLSGSLVSGDTVTYSAFGSQTLIGESENTFNVTINNISGTNYSIQKVYGILRVTDDDVQDNLIIVLNLDSTGPYNYQEEITFSGWVTNPYDQEETITLTAIAGLTLSQSVWNNVASGETVSFTASVTVDEAMIINQTYTATITASINNLTKQAQNDSATFIEPTPSVTINYEETSVPGNGEYYTVNEEITWSYEIINDGNLTLTNLSITDSLAGSVYQVAFLAPDASVTFTGSYTVQHEDIGTEVLTTISVDATEASNTFETITEEIYFYVAEEEEEEEP